MKTTVLTRTVAALALAVSGVLVGGVAQPAHAQPPECRNRDLTASYHARGDAAGHRYGVIELTNTSGDRVCSVRGYGGLSYVGDGNGTQVGAAATRTPGRVRTVVLDPGQGVVSRVDQAVAQDYPRSTCRPEHVDGFRVYAPDATRSQYVAHATTGCADPAVHLLAHGPFHRPAHRG